MLVGSTLTWVRGGGICAGWRAVEFVHRENAEGLETTGTRQRFADDARALVGGLVAVAAKAGHVQQHIGPAIVGNDEAEALADIEPLDGADNLDDIETSLVALNGMSFHSTAFGRHPGVFPLGWKLCRHAPNAFSYTPRRKRGTQ